MATLRIIVLLAIAITCVFCDEDEDSSPSPPSPTLPPMKTPAKPDPYGLSCSGGGYGCPYGLSPPPLFPRPPSCYYGYCSYIEYINTPWSSDKGLVIQPKCDIPFGKRTIPTGKLRLRILFYSGHVQKIVQWSFKEIYSGLYTNDQPYYGGTDEFQFQVFYYGSVTYWPKYVYTPPPAGICVFDIAH